MKKVVSSAWPAAIVNASPNGAGANGPCTQKSDMPSSEDVVYLKVVTKWVVSTALAFYFDQPILRDC